MVAKRISTTLNFSQRLNDTIHIGINSSQNHSKFALMLQILINISGNGFTFSSNNYSWLGSWFQRFLGKLCCKVCVKIYSLALLTYFQMRIWSHWYRFESNPGIININMDHNAEPLTNSCFGLPWKIKLFLGGGGGKSAEFFRWNSCFQRVKMINIAYSIVRWYAFCETFFFDKFV